MKSPNLIASVLLLASIQWVTADVTITRQPTNATVSLGATAQFTVTAGSTAPPITYQWWFKDAALDVKANPSAATSRLSLTNVTTANAGPYLAVASDQSGSVTSQVVTLTVDPTFTKITKGPLVEDLQPSATPPSWGDYDNDGLFDLYTFAEGGTNTLHLNRGDWKFEDATVASGVSFRGTCYSPTVGDFDNDGDLDIYVASHDGRDVLFVNRGDGTFDTVDVGSPLVDGVSDGAVWVDYNNDGFLDLFKTCGDGIPAPSLLYRNSLSTAGNTNHWLKVQLRGIPSNRSGIGARVWTRAMIQGREVQQVRQLTSSGFGGGATGGLVIHFGLGDAAKADSVRIEWPSGNVQELTNVALNQLLTIAEQVNITPTNPSSSLNGSVTLTSSLTGAYQWRSGGTDLAGETNKTLKLAGIQASQAGRYAVVVTTSSQTVTNCAYLHVDPTFTQITEGPIVHDVGNAMGHSWGDYDNDGFPDLFVANGVWNASGSPGAPMSSFLYHNKGDGTFLRITNSPLTYLKLDANGAAFGDYDNDGFLDLLVAIGGSGPNMLWHNNGEGTFTRMTNSPLATDRPNNCFGATWADYDNDGLVDAFATVWNQGNDLLYRNNGDGTFTRMTAADAGNVVLDQSATSAPAWADYDNDGWPDVFVVVDTVGASGSKLNKNLLYHNRGNGVFERVTNDIIAQQGGTSMGGAWGDYDNDGWPDLFVPSDAGGRSYLYHNLQNGHFEEVTSGPLVHDAGPLSIMGCWGDYDNDGFLDLYVAKLGGGLLYHNNGDGTFNSVTTGSIVTHTGNCATASWVDYDNDGFLDLFVGHGSAGRGQISRLYHNNGNSNAWLVVKPVGTKSNRSAIGAKVRVFATYVGKARTQLREIGSTESWKGPNLDAHFGLGDATNVMTLRIEWPSGVVQELSNVTPKQLLTVWEPPALSGTVLTNGSCELTITAEPNRPWRIEASTDLEAWQTVKTVTSNQTTFQYTDTAANAFDWRFYRIVAE